MFQNKLQTSFETNGIIFIFVKKKILKKGVLQILLMLLAISVWNCAHQVMPSGGPKDTAPPKIIEEIPPSGSTNFTGNRFMIKFDEFVELDQINKQLLISPPMLKMPGFHINGKTLIVKFNEPLKPNTTYSVYFGSAIVDITEKNPLANYSYIFSTGPTIDSMSLSGTLVNAFDLKPVEDVYVMLYKDNNDTISLDSMPLLVKPYYVSKTDKSGKFRFKALADTAYLIFGLNDKNNSLTFDQPTEEIAFSDSLVRPQYIAPAKVDTVVRDTLIRGSDTLASVLSDSTLMINGIDSTEIRQDTEILQTPTVYELFMFVNEDTVQKVTEAKAESPDKLRFVFSLPGDSVKIEPVETDTGSLHFVTDHSRYNDTVWWLLKEPHPDTLNLLFLNGKDTLEKRTLQLTAKEKRATRKNRKENEEKKSLQFNVNLRGIIKPGQSPVIIFEQPVRRFDNDSVLLVAGNDSVYKPEYRFADTLHRKIFFPLAVKPGTTYRLLIPDSAVWDWNGYTNEKIDISLRAKEDKEYGKLTFKVHVGISTPHIIQMLDPNEKIIVQKRFAKDTVFRFNYLDPAKYKIKVIFDDNGNGKWDTGNYLQKRQPERVLWFPKEMDIKANWEYEEEWRIE